MPRLLRPITDSLIRSSSKNSRVFARFAHTVPELNATTTSGIPGLFSSKNIEQNWFNYQTYLVNSLNELTKDTGAENKTFYEIAKMTSQNPDLRALNYISSQAYNNYFFYYSVAPAKIDEAAPKEEFYVAPNSSETKFVDISTEFVNAPSKDYQVTSKIIDTFGSVTSFRELLINQATSIFGNGYVWLVYNPRDGQVYVVNTYNSGVPFGNSYAEAVESVEDAENETIYGKISNEARELLAEDKAKKNGIIPGLIPLLNINMWQNAWVDDYGVAGKRKYVENVWNTLRWDIIEARLNAVTKRGQTTEV
ncbi:manganese and iron superoxide dismutase [Nadsonia fulvescens var. elongata DSM 6958]|uniref:Manganese and iron superoxide dismutase n=1 Tax=Nadsonia fulvescens var. elongata DSM 6958 TaxID=857566 RepID=A0A1E3PQ53_9ASCO|nr:manganese and iron superoxide dismutase [Nadsonia fulvescens var. elongata DSM 6958]